MSMKNRSHSGLMVLVRIRNLPRQPPGSAITTPDRNTCSLVKTCRPCHVSPCRRHLLNSHSAQSQPYYNRSSFIDKAGVVVKLCNPSMTASPSPKNRGTRLHDTAVGTDYLFPPRLIIPASGTCIGSRVHVLRPPASAHQKDISELSPSPT
jgi:hypothetical protein